jgi:hypothetical protein
MEQASGKIAGKDFGVGYYPEFLRESTAIEDYYDPGLIVFGALDARPTILNELNRDLPCVCPRGDLRDRRDGEIHLEHLAGGQGDLRQRDRQHRQGLRASTASRS